MGTLSYVHLGKEMTEDHRGQWSVVSGQWSVVRTSCDAWQPIRPRIACRSLPEKAAELSEPSGEFSAAGSGVPGSGRLRDITG